MDKKKLLQLAVVCLLLMVSLPKNVFGMDLTKQVRIKTSGQGEGCGPVYIMQPQDTFKMWLEWSNGTKVPNSEHVFSVGTPLEYMWTVNKGEVFTIKGEGKLAGGVEPYSFSEEVTADKDQTIKNCVSIPEESA